MDVPQLPEKDFFRMGETCRIAQVPPHTLRYWEAHFGCLRPARRRGGHRHYTREDLRTILSIKDLLQRRKMTIAGAKRALSARNRESGAAGESAFTGSAAEKRGGSSEKLLREIKKELQALLEELR